MNIFSFLQGLILYVSCAGQLNEDEKPQYSTTHIKELTKTVERLQHALSEANKKIEDISDKLGRFEMSVSKRYPEVRFLNYLTRKRILVNSLYFFGLFDRNKS